MAKNCKKWLNNAKQVENNLKCYIKRQKIVKNGKNKKNKIIFFLNTT